jgi:hypothetical protein
MFGRIIQGVYFYGFAQCDHGIWNAATHALTHGGRPAAAPTAYHSPMDALAKSYRLALSCAPMPWSGAMGHFHFLAMHEQMK